MSKFTEDDFDKLPVCAWELPPELEDKLRLRKLPSTNEKLIQPHPETGDYWVVDPKTFAKMVAEGYIDENGKWLL